MVKEKEIEQMAEVIRSNNERMFHCCDGYLNTPHDDATYLYEAGYGNVQQAVKEFAEKLKRKAQIYFVDTDSDYECEAVDINDIDNLITQLYGVDE